ncbi:aminotransferase class IV [Candidatus Neptunichlamydia sp. REUL1]|uniref:aminotransferase class IV n=1 Tax=Candidatus Neptunichlamydia sp. REUL1 TaxID=3064277 RepID=UPI00292F121C|nr:aminotransferase class IV [Candidatus Neptunochlamydia sp. REUL1]
MTTLVYINGQFIDGSEAKVSALDLSVLRGFGVMDYLRTYGGTPFRLRAHLERFVASAALLGLEVPVGMDVMEEVIQELISRGGFQETSVKVVLTGGVSTDQLMPEGEPTFFVVAYPFAPFPRRHFEEGIFLTTEVYQRPFPKAKSIHYLPAIIALRKAEKRGAVDVLFHDEKGWIRETGTANFFAIKKGKIITPKEGILEGITREVVMELCDVEEREIHRDEIGEFEGAFLASSNKEVMPVISIDNCVINNRVIPLTIRNLMQSFANHTKLSEKNLLHNI